MKKANLIGVILLFFVTPYAVATTYYVNGASGNNNWDGLAPVWDGLHGPKRTIQAAMGVAAVSVVEDINVAVTLNVRFWEVQGVGNEIG